MRLTTVILIACLMQVSAAGLAQKITLNERNAPLSTVLKEIRKQSGYDIFFDGKSLPQSQKVTVVVNGVSVADALDQAFKGLSLTYKIDGNTIAVKQKESAKSALEVQEKRADVTGRVTNSKGEPLPGATVLVKGSKIGAVSESDGRFRITGAPENGTLIITMIGYISKEFPYRSGSPAIIILTEADQTLKEIVIAYGTVKEKYSTSNAVSVSGDVISRQAVSNPLIALQGRSTGLYIRQNSGLNTAPIDITVQGKNSLRNGNEPFYVIDGVPFISTSLGGLGVPSVSGTIGNSSGVSNLNYINPNEIESITILKDADATAIYGSRAANGAILITTKKGKAGQTRASFNMQSGWGKVGKFQKLLNTDQYIALKKEVYANANQPLPESMVDATGVWDVNRNVDWQKEILGGTSQFQNLQSSISGGSERTQFLAGVTYIRETPVYHGDFSNVKASVNFNVNHASNNQKFKFFLSGSYLDGKNVLPNQDPTSDIRLAPNFPDLVNPDGTINWAPVPGIFPVQSTSDNPAAKLKTTYTNKAGNLIANSNLSYEIISGLTLRSSFGYNNLSNYESSFRPFAVISAQSKINGVKPSANYSTKRISSWIAEPQLAYSKSFSFGNIDALLGTTFQSTDNYLLSESGTNYASDLQLGDLNAAGTKAVSGSVQAQYNYAAVFGRLNYRLKDKYIINLAARRDGSSRFGSENLFNSFYSIGGAWIFSDEPVMKNVIPFLNYGKIRASYGTSGNDQIRDYSFYSLYAPPFGISNPYLGVAALNPTGLSNPYLQWEETKKLNLGIDLGFLDNAILFTGNYFRNRSSNQLLAQNLSQVTGFPTIDRNLPALVQNKGWELSVQYSPFKKTAFTWEGSFNITLPENKLLRYDGLETSSDRYTLKIGESISGVNVYSYSGVNTQTGLYEFYTAKGELTSNPNELTDKFAFFTTDPKYYGGFNNTFAYKRFSLDVFFTFTNRLVADLKYASVPGATRNRNDLAAVLDYWKKPGDMATVQRVTVESSVYENPYRAMTQSDGIYKNARYARLNNAMLSYSFDSELIKRSKMSYARIYVQGQNLFVISNYKTGDPEVGTLLNIGLLRTYSIGAQFTF